MRHKSCQTTLRCGLVRDIPTTAVPHLGVIMVAMTDTPEDLPQPAWAKLLQEQRESRGYSIRKAAILAGMSDSFWGMAERGWKPVRGESSRPMKPSRASFIQMAQGMRLSPQTTNAILVAADFRPVPAVGERPDPSSDVDLRGLNQGDIALLNAISKHLRDNKGSGKPKYLRSRSSLHPWTASNRETVE